MPWAGVPVRIRWFNGRWICREHTCQIATFTEQNHSVCAPRARLGARAIRWAIRQLRVEGATTCGLARQLATTWNTVWSHIKPCLQAASDDPARFAGVRVLGVDEHVWHHQDRRRRGPTRAHRHRRPDTQEGAPHGPLERTWSQEGLAPRMRTGWPSVEKTSVRGCESRLWIPFQGQQERHRLACSQGATSVLDAFHIVKLAGDAPGEVRRRVQQDTLGHRGRKGDPLYQIRNLLRASRAHAHPTSTRTPPRGLHGR